MQNADCRLDAPGRQQTEDCRLQTADWRTATDTPNRHVKFKCQRETRQTTSEQREWGTRMGLELRLKLKWKRKYVWGEGENYLKR